MIFAVAAARRYFNIFRLKLKLKMPAGLWEKSLAKGKSSSLLQLLSQQLQLLFPLLLLLLLFCLLTFLIPHKHCQMAIV